MNFGRYRATRILPAFPGDLLFETADDDALRSCRAVKKPHSRIVDRGKKPGARAHRVIQTVWAQLRKVECKAPIKARAIPFCALIPPFQERVALCGWGPSPRLSSPMHDALQRKRARLAHGAVPPSTSATQRQDRRKQSLQPFARLREQSSQQCLPCSETGKFGIYGQTRSRLMHSRSSGTAALMSRTWLISRRRSSQSG